MFLKALAPQKRTNDKAVDLNGRILASFAPYQRIRIGNGEQDSYLAIQHYFPMPPTVPKNLIATGPERQRLPLKIYALGKGECRKTPAS